MAEEITTKKIEDLGENMEPADADVFLFGASGGNIIKKIKWGNLMKKLKALLFVNNRTTTEEGFGLDARQGEADTGRTGSTKHKDTGLLHPDCLCEKRHGGGRGVFRQHCPWTLVRWVLEVPSYPRFKRIPGTKNQQYYDRYAEPWLL